MVSNNDITKALQKNLEVLGSAMLSKTELINGTGDRKEYELSQFGGKNSVMSTGNKKVSSWYDMHAGVS